MQIYKRREGVDNATIYIQSRAEEGNTIFRVQVHSEDGRRGTWHFSATSLKMQRPASYFDYRGRDKNMTLYNRHSKKIEAAASSAAIYII